MATLVELAYQTLEGWLALGHETHGAELARFARSERTPLVYDSNFGSRVRAETPAEIDAVLQRADELFAGFGHRHFVWDPALPLPFEARLLLEGYTAHAEIVLALEGELRREPPPMEVRPVHSEADWSSLAELTRLDHRETAALGRHADWPQVVTDQMLECKRAKAPAVTYFLARLDGRDCAFFAAWPGENGVGKVDDLFTDPDFRGRGAALALIAHAVRDARRRGAGPVLISALPDDTPKQLYAELGFRPLCISRSYVWRAAPRSR